LAKIISTHSFRGGTGKSNTTANLAVLVDRAGNRVGVIDTDIQSATSPRMRSARACFSFRRA
jgi:septum site-determining protein MinD